MSESFPTFAPGTVGNTMLQMHGTWHDRIETFHLDGSPLNDDTAAGSGTPGGSPFDNLVYIDFDGHRLLYTNVHIRGREPVAKSFTGQMKDGVLVFDELGPGAYENIAVSGGPNILTFTSRRIEKACEVYFEPDFIMLTGNGERLRHTVLYRHGIATRTLTAKGVRLSPLANTRHPLDPRGPDGPVHEEPFSAKIWEDLV